MPYVGWICCQVSRLLREVSLRVTRVFLSPKNVAIPNSISTTDQVDHEKILKKEIKTILMGFFWSEVKRLGSRLFLVHLDWVEWINSYYILVSSFKIVGMLLYIRCVHSCQRNTNKNLLYMLQTSLLTGFKTALHCTWITTIKLWNLATGPWFLARQSAILGKTKPTTRRVNRYKVIYWKHSALPCVIN